MKTFLIFPPFVIAHHSFYFQDLFDEILSQKSELNKVRDRAEAIAQRSSDMRVSSGLMQLSTQYQQLCSSAKVG